MDTLCCRDLCIHQMLSSTISAYKWKVRKRLACFWRNTSAAFLFAMQLTPMQALITFHLQCLTLLLCLYLLPSYWSSIPNTSTPSSFFPSGYHPISLLFPVSKILERHVFNVLSSIISENNILSNNQFGVWYGFFTECVLVCFFF